MTTEAMGVTWSLRSFEPIMDTPSCKGHTIYNNLDAIFLILPDSHTIETLYVLEYLVVLLRPQLTPTPLVENYDLVCDLWTWANGVWFTPN